ncbi:phosphoadenosine phosphosulfate reductase family protein [Citrobacter freundii]|uniref:phosphoadenosine phosphosulfate reductase family protein n=1 Tax=Citrobacter freundii TaxID=546 RepID=UPI0022559474|nr:phosphoadenosine phosphosulfate reductase family protein [Citrobacter freundii]MCX3157466.1 phosphoadenosine phosphosulfate reductase family protein [Citrobacter freundii]MCX3161939.1 phosphoadenosine phosphosulfate reductase family protein [Citrobacter freundii]MDH2706288.1 phosphoadenosine phosphosulfate reductase family protein [Citrobacter freundii]HED2454760.1 phosphoadenosine phosphosulfate reductase family protein [Citrobacter freundii]
MTRATYKVPKICFDPSALNVISLSGGKDSLAQKLIAIEAGVSHISTFADTGHEHPLTMDYIDYLEQKLGAIKRVKADFTARMGGKRKFIAEKWPHTLVTECGMTDSQARERVSRALELLHPTGIPFLDLCMWKGRFPSTKARFCTFELKHEPIKTQVVEPALAEFDEVISWQGVRAQESPARVNLPEWEEDIDDTPGLSVYRPIHKWLHEDVFAIARRHGIKPNPLYEQGCSRVGCLPCINVRKSELAEIFSRWPEEIRRVAEWERLVAECSRRGNSTFSPSTHDPRRAEKRIECISVDAYGIETYRDWALTTHGGTQFDLLADAYDKSVCNSVYAGVCE